ncbi:glycoside hydrolase family 88 protein [Jiangella endophytica]|uniref:glycoside hydrolase family 88 protein n=1 Tax=Jiangella endophytica TaxID=1623398 RepID=UPI000E350D3F|nr:glycoside hydrolase family 88 protein [Jiangella endophytica]
MTAIDAVAKRCMSRDVSELNTGWEDTLVPLGLTLAGGALHDEAMVSWARQWADHHLDAQPTTRPETGFSGQHSGEDRQGIYLTTYCGDWGVAMALAALHRHEPDERLLDAVRLVADHILDGGLRLDDGTIAHGHWAPAPWVDTLYYAAAPLAWAYAVLGDRRYATEAVRQCLLHARHLRDPLTGCFFHETDPATGVHTGSLWSRGNGWVAMSFADVLRHTAADTPGWSELLELYRSLVTGLLRFQHPTGLWRITPDDDESHLETSGSTMIATGIAVGLAEGWLNRSAATRVIRTWHEVVTWVDGAGAVRGCQTPAGRGGWESHKRSGMGERTYGNGAFLRLAAELRAAGLLGTTA